MPALTSIPQIIYAEATLDAEDGAKVGIRIRTRAYLGASPLEMEAYWSAVPIPLDVDWWEDFGTPDIQTSWTDEGYTYPA